jgi:hypothetical protein
MPAARLRAAGERRDAIFMQPATVRPGLRAP